jgi:hypothetical protein
MAIATAILSLLAVLVPALIGYRVDTAPKRRRETIDDTLLHGSPLDVGAALSELYDDASGPASYPNPVLPGDRPSPV